MKRLGNIHQTPKLWICNSYNHQLKGEYHQLHTVTRGSHMALIYHKQAGHREILEIVGQN